MENRKLFALFVLFTLIVDVFGSAIVYRNERSISSNHRTNREAESSLICENKTPCGWAIYKRFTRQVDFFMKNSCECASGKKCVRSDDDISISAYVYRCQQTT